MMVKEFSKASALIRGWDTKTGNFKKFTEMLENLGRKGSLTAEACRSYTNDIKTIQAYSRDDDDPVDHFIGQEIATIGNLVQMREDDGNAREGHGLGVGYYPRAGGS